MQIDEVYLYIVYTNEMFLGFVLYLVVIFIVDTNQMFLGLVLSLQLVY